MAERTSLRSWARLGGSVLLILGTIALVSTDLETAVSLVDLCMVVGYAFQTWVASADSVGSIRQSMGPRAKFAVGTLCVVGMIAVAASDVTECARTGGDRCPRLRRLPVRKRFSRCSVRNRTRRRRFERRRLPVRRGRGARSVLDGRYQSIALHRGGSADGRLLPSVGRARPRSRSIVGSRLWQHRRSDRSSDSRSRVAPLPLWGSVSDPKLFL